MKTLFYITLFSILFLSFNNPPTEKKILFGSSENCVAYINWLEVSNDSISHYELQYSDEGSVFISMGKCLPRNPEKYFYHGRAIGVFSKENMFRLKVYMLNGDFYYSNVLMIKSDCKELAQ